MALTTWTPVADRAGFLTSAQLCRLVGMSYRQLDHWTRLKVLRPSRAARGQGTARGWACQDALLAQVVAVLADLGCPLGRVAGPVVTALSVHPEWWGAGVMVVGPDGAVTAGAVLEGESHGWLVDLRACWDRVMVAYPAPREAALAV
jgi:hypothetical protein